MTSVRVTPTPRRATDWEVRIPGGMKEGFDTRQEALAVARKHAQADHVPIEVKDSLAGSVRVIPP